MPHLRGRGLSLRLGGRAVLEQADATLAPGSLLGVIGANGAGKSTLLRVLAGLRRAGAGRVELDGEALDAIPPPRLARLRAFLPQDAAPTPGLTVAQIVRLGRLAHRAEAAADRAAVARALAVTATTPLAGRAIETLSGGERARVLLARALAVEAPVLLVDEPVAALDPAHALRIMGVLRGLAGSGAAVAVVLHDLTLAARFCDRLLLLHAGRALAEGPPEAVLTDPHLARAFGVTVRRAEGIVVPWEVLGGGG